jgi:hypothetical protein
MQKADADRKPCRCAVLLRVGRGRGSDRKHELLRMGERGSSISGGGIYLDSFSYYIISCAARLYAACFSHDATSFSRSNLGSSGSEMTVDYAAQSRFASALTIRI